MLKRCQNSLAVQEYTQETADQMLQIKTARQSQLRTFTLGRDSQKENQNA